MDYSSGGISFHISGFLADYLIFLIVILGIAEAVLAVIAGKKLHHLLNRTIALNKPRNVRSTFPRKEGRGRIAKEMSGSLSKDYHYDLDQPRDEYEDTLRWYTAFSMLIQVFPLLGILGTVSGLFRAISLRQEIYAGVQFALASTIYGLIFAIIFKIVDTMFVALMINRIEEGFERYEKDYRIDSEAADLEMHEAETADPTCPGPVTDAGDWL